MLDDRLHIAEQPERYRPPADLDDEAVRVALRALKDAVEGLRPQDFHATALACAGLKSHRSPIHTIGQAPNSGTSHVAEVSDVLTAYTG